MTVATDRKALLVELKTISKRFNSATAGKLIKNGYKNLEDLREVPPTKELLDEWRISGMQLALMVNYLSEQVEDTKKVEKTGMETLFGKLADALPAKPLSERTWQWLLTELVKNPKDVEILNAFEAKPEIRKARRRAHKNLYALTQKGEFSKKLTEKNITFLQGRQTPKRVYPNGIRAISLKKALGANEKVIRHPVNAGETLYENGRDAEGLQWIGNDDLPDDAEKAIFWAGGKCPGIAPHRLYRSNHEAIDIYDGLIDGMRRYVTIMNDYQYEVEENGLVVDMTVNEDEAPPANFMAKIDSGVRGRSGHETQYQGGGDTINVGNITGGKGVAVGRGASANVNHVVKKTGPYKVQVSYFIRDWFSLAETEDICYQMGIEVEDAVIGQGKNGKINHFVQFVERRGRLVELANIVANLRPSKETSW